MSAQVYIDPLVSRIDQSVHIIARNLPANTRAMVRATTNNILGLNCTAESWATFVSDSHGTIDLDVHRPIAGTYQNVDGMGLLWSMVMRDVTYLAAACNADLNYEPRETVVRLSVEIEGKTVGEADCVRLLYDHDVYLTNVTEQDMVGKLFVKEGAQPAPAVILLGGGEGGVASPMTYAALLASHGYPSFALAYFRFEHLPSRMREIPLEYFTKPVQWLKQHPSCNGTVVVYGRSKGAELALLLGAHNPEVSAVIASSPSSTVCVGDVQKGENGRFATYSSWSLQGTLLPFVPWSNELCLEAERCLNSGQRVDHVHRQACKKAEAVGMYDIPVEKTRGPVFLISSGDDHWWPATWHAERIESRLRKHHFAYEYLHLDYPSAGHVIRFPGVPTTQLRMNGGTPEANHVASSESWQEILSFLKGLLS